jgi:hypothetical protein
VCSGTEQQQKEKEEEEEEEKRYLSWLPDLMVLNERLSFRPAAVLFCSISLVEDTVSSSR